jgi:antitoxin (DNA-binding transcriptional repressor) of toxin-antitoxin stability system
LRNNGAEVFARVERGERPIVTRDGQPVAELRPLPARSEGPTELVERRKRLPRVDPEALRRAVDTVVDASLS